MPDRKIVAACKRAAIAAGYYLREGAYVGTADDVAGTWYVVHENDDFLRLYGRGHRTQSAAWVAANKEADLMRWVGIRSHYTNLGIGPAMPAG